jgi:hypothetical protein
VVAAPTSFSFTEARRDSPLLVINSETVILLAVVGIAVIGFGLGWIVRGPRRG